MTTHRVFIGLGSNLGDRAAFLKKAGEHLKNLRESRVVWYSSVYETDPYGKEDQGRFLNAVGEIETTLLPPALLTELKSIEIAVGREQREHWGPREIDLDILLYDGFVYQDDQVTVPHPEMEKRKFVLVPLREIAPDLVHPVSGLTVEELSASCPDHGRVVKTLYRIPV